MTVKKLIAELKKMPQNVQVYTAGHDNEEWEIQSGVTSVAHYKKSNFHPMDRQELSTHDDEWVTIHG